MGNIVYLYCAAAIKQYSIQSNFIPLFSYVMIELTPGLVIFEGSRFVLRTDSNETAREQGWYSGECCVLKQRNRKYT